MTWASIIDYLESSPETDLDYVAIRMKALGDVSEVAHAGAEYDYGHHDLESIVRTSDGFFYAAESSGCSCDASGSLHGPFITYEEARARMSNYSDKLPSHLEELDHARE